MRIISNSFKKINLKAYERYTIYPKNMGAVKHLFGQWYRHPSPKKILDGPSPIMKHARTTCAHVTS